MIKEITACMIIKIKLCLICYQCAVFKMFDVLLILALLHFSYPLVTMSLNFVS